MLNKYYICPRKHLLTMDIPFDYKNAVVGADFLSRKKELNTITNYLRQKQNVLIYDSPKTGKRSLVQQTLLNLQKLAYPFKVCNVNLFNVRSSDVLFRNMAHQIASGISNTLEEWNEFSQKYLANASLDSEEHLTDEQIKNIINLPERLSEEYQTNYIVYFEDFQNILLFDDPDAVFKILEKEWKGHVATTYLITGSQVNAMKHIFEEVKYFYRFAEYLPLAPLEEKAVTDQIMRTFLKVGRVVDQNLAEMIYESVGGHPSYIWQISSIAFNLTKGYLNDKIVQEAIYSVLAIHDTYFRSIVDDLSNYQISFLRAIYDGVTRFSSVSIIEQYKLNSSANVHRLKEALKKKEIVTFDEKDEPVIIDPLFKIWLTKFYFAR